MPDQDIFDKLSKNKEEAEKKTAAQTKENVKSNVDGNGNSKNTITLTNKEEKSKLKRTYYIDPEQEKNITWASRKTGRDKSEIVRMALDFFFENVNVEWQGGETGG